MKNLADLADLADLVDMCTTMTILDKVNIAILLFIAILLITV